MSDVCGIYRITNQVNGKVYIGQSRNVAKRWQQHISNRKGTHNDYLAKSLSKYGTENFVFDLLEECEPEKLDCAEREYIILYNSLRPNGYNIESGGWAQKQLSEETKLKIGAALSIPVNQYSLTGKYIETYSSAQEVAKMTGNAGDRSNIQMVCLGKKLTCLGFQWRYSVGNIDDIKPVKNYRREKGAKVSQFTVDGFWVATYANRFEASRRTGLNPKNIFCCLSGASKSAGGFIWKYEEPTLCQAAKI